MKTDGTPDGWNESGESVSDPGNMDGDAAIETPDPDERRPLGNVWTEAFVDATRLFQTEVTLGQREIRDNLGAFGRAAAFGGVAILFSGLAIVFLLAAAIVALAMVIGLLWALLLTGIVSLLVAVVLAVTARATVRGRGLLPKRSIGRIRRDIAKLQNRTDDLQKAEET
ncbi:MAG: phage holin family protein [Sphingomonadaceae bacterium]